MATTLAGSNTILRRPEDLPGLPSADAERMREVTRTFIFRVSPYYASLIDWGDEDDPLRRIVLPSVDELSGATDFDPSNELASTKVHGLQHKYPPTALLLLNDFCAAYCRFCFRKRFTLAKGTENHLVPFKRAGLNETETTFNVGDGVAYIAAHNEIDNVLLTGGDPLMLPPQRLGNVLAQLRALQHIRVIRIGSKVPAFDPERLTDELLRTLERYNSPGRPIQIVLHFNHPRELTAIATDRLRVLRNMGIPLYNQTPLLKGVNDDPFVLGSLLDGLVAEAVRPYYIFHCRPTAGNDHFLLSVQKGLSIIEQARRARNGMAKSFRYVASHDVGKIEIVGRLAEDLILRLHEAREPGLEGLVFSWPYNREIAWFDEVITARSLGSA